MKKCSLTDIGMRREMNQDYFYSSEEPVGSLPNLFVVADGMGGHNAGEFASRYAVETMVNTAKNTEKTDTIGILTECVSNANASLWAYAGAHDEMRGMGTTLVAAVLDGRRLVTVNVGDSRLYVIGDGIRQITEDHSLVQEMVRMGEMDRESARTHPDRNIITRAVGADRKVQTDVFETVLEPGDRILLCSDGLTNMVEDQRILQVMNGEGDLTSKTESLSGYRLGAAFGTEAVIERMEKLQAIMALRCSGYNQAVFLTWFNEPEGFMENRLKKHMEIRDAILEVIRETPGVSAKPTEGGSYLFVTIPELEVSLHQFIRIVREMANVIVTPGTEFGPQYLHQFRINFSQDKENAVAAMKRLFAIMDRYRKQA